VCVDFFSQDGKYLMSLSPNDFTDCKSIFGWAEFGAWKGSCVCSGLLYHKLLLQSPSCDEELVSVCPTCTNY
jgi:hypothetical protein